MKPAGGRSRFGRRAMLRLLLSWAMACLPGCSLFPASYRLRLALVPDIHLGQPGTRGRENLGRLLAILAAQEPDACLLAGDLVHDAPELLPALSQDLRTALTCPVWAVRGNHDLVSARD